MRKVGARFLQRFILVGFFSLELLTVHLPYWLGQKLQSSGECSSISAATLCHAEKPQGAGSLACPGGLVADIELPQWHQCPPRFPRSCTRKAWKTLQLVTVVIKHSPSSSGYNTTRNPSSWNVIFSCSAHLGTVRLFPCGCLAARFFGLWFLQRLRGRWAERPLRGQDPRHQDGSWQLSASWQLDKPTIYHSAHARERSAASLPSGSHLSSVSCLCTSLFSAGYTTQIHLTFPHKPYLPPTILFALFSTKNWSQKCRTDLPTAERSRQIFQFRDGVYLLLF